MNGDKKLSNTQFSQKPLKLQFSNIQGYSKTLDFHDTLKLF